MKLDEQISFWEDGVVKAEEYLRNGIEIHGENHKIVNCYRNHLAWCKDVLAKKKAARAETIGKKK